jgi:uncharacterized lipoprotein YajG
MKKLYFLLACLLLLVAGCATQKTTTSHVENVPVYYNGNDEPSASSGVFLYQTNN